MIRQLKARSDLTTEHSPVLYPTFGSQTDDGNWRVHVQGTVTTDEIVSFRQRLMLRVLRRAMQVGPDELNGEVFRQRIRGFIASPESRRVVTVVIGHRRWQLRRKTNRAGLFSAVLRLTQDDLARIVSEGQATDGVVPYSIVSMCGQQRAAGRIHLVPRRGVSVISDIDDTVKHTGVGCRKTVLANTFLNEFRCIDGMADTYRRWQDQGVRFHYVSSSPWQLFAPLADMIHSNDFPDGSIHLRPFRLRDHMVKRLLVFRRPGKGKVIERILEAFPERRFVLVGDSGERDPEIYGKLAARFGEQVQAVFIRHTEHRRFDDDRGRKVFRQFDGWRAFDHADELPLTCDWRADL